MLNFTSVNQSAKSTLFVTCTRSLISYENEDTTHHVCQSWYHEPAFFQRIHRLSIPLLSFCFSRTHPTQMSRCMQSWPHSQQQSSQ